MLGRLMIAHDLQHELIRRSVGRILVLCHTASLPVV
jgi:hypothetical protein